MFVLLYRKWINGFCSCTVISHHRGFMHIKYTLALCHNKVLLPILPYLLCIFVISHKWIAECYSYFVYWPFTIKVWCMFHSLSKQGTCNHFCSVKFTFVRNPQCQTLSHAGNMLLSKVVLNWYQHLFTVADNQFWFKSNLSTDMCIYARKQVTEYYVKLGSPMYIYFLDASKAFDNINHWILFSNMLDRNVPHFIVQLLLVWYNEQNVYLHWNNIISEPFIYIGITSYQNLSLSKMV